MQNICVQPVFTIESSKCNMFFFSVQKELWCLHSYTILSWEGGELSGEVLVDFGVLLNTRLIFISEGWVVFFL